MTQTTNDKTSSKDALLAAAHRLFIQKGYDAVSTRELADAAGVNLGAIQYHFGSKGQLFVETMKTLMEGEWPEHIYALLEQNSDDSAQAARSFGLFVRAFLEDLISDDQLQPCRMMIRELFTPTCADKEMYEALVSNVTDNFIRPAYQQLRHTLEIVAPARTEEEYGSAIHNVFSQCFFYLTNGPFIERLKNVQIKDKDFLDRAADQICISVLRELCCREELISGALYNKGRPQR